MANKTLLDCVNEILKRVNVNAGNASALTSLTDSARQHNIDVAVQVINEAIDDLYNASDVELPGEGKEATVTLVTGQREYSLATDLITLRWPMIDRPNTQYLYEWTEGYDRLLFLDPQQLYTGLPLWGMISPITSKLRVDRAPTSVENGHAYTYEYDFDMVMAIATDTVPFNNEVFRAMVPAWVQLYKREMRNEFDDSLYRMSMGRAARTVIGRNQRNDYSPRYG